MNQRGQRNHERRLWHVIARQLLLVLLIIFVLMLVAPWLSFIEVRAFDFLFALQPTRQPDPRVEIVDIGDSCDLYEKLRNPHDSRESGCEIPRLVYAEAVRRLSRWGAKVIVFDVYFRRSCQYEDEQLAQAFKEAGNVIVAASAKVEPGAVGLKDPVSPLKESVAGVGSPVAHQPNETVRSIPLVVRDRDSGREYMALSLVAFQHFAKIKAGDTRLGRGGWLFMDGIKAPVLTGERIHLMPVGDEGEKETLENGNVAGIQVVQGSNVILIPRLKTWNALLINWVGPRGTIHPRQLSDLLAIKDDREGRKLYADKAVIIGQVDWDVHWTAVGAMPGLEVQANALETLISRSFIRPISPWSMMGILLAFSLASIAAVRKFRGIRVIGAVLVLMVLAIVLARQLLLARGIWMYLFYCELSIGLTWGIGTFAESDKVSTLLARFVPSFIGKAGVEGLGEIRTMEASILFSDIRGYTGTAERLSAADTMAMLNRYQSAVEDIITKYGGTIVKTPGDAILAVFWKKVGNLNHATCAVRSGQEMLQQLPSLARAWEAAGVSLEIGVGINAGSVAFGLVGKRHLEPTVIGDPVNVSQRLESLTKTLSCPLIFSESVREMLGEDMEVIHLDEITVRGREMPLRVYTISGLEGLERRPELLVAKETIE